MKEEEKLQFYRSKKELMGVLFGMVFVIVEKRRLIEVTPPRNPVVVYGSKSQKASRVERPLIP